MRIFTSANQSSQLCVDVFTIEDNTVEDMEMFSVFLSSSDPAANIIITTANVIILDDDSKCKSLITTDCFVLIGI